MMVPPGTSCPPNALNPSRCAFESRPFREVPCPFLCAIEWSSKRGQDALATAGETPALLLFYFFLAADFFLAAFLGAAFFFLADPFLAACACASCVSSSAAFTFFSFGSFFGNSG